jgi:hypothetical protein
MSHPADHSGMPRPISGVDLATTRAFAGVGVLTDAPRPTENPMAGLLEALERIAVALERPRGEATQVVIRMPDSHEAREAISGRDWSKAATLLEAMADHPERGRLGEELAAARAVVADDLRCQLSAAREVNDPERVLLIHDELAPLLTSGDLHEIQQESVKWFLKLIMRRMRTGTVRADVADLASRVADRFGSTLEGASLRASLPTLRRSAGLCPKCGAPYAGLGDSCPTCVMSAALKSIPDPPLEDDTEEDDTGNGTFRLSQTPSDPATSPSSTKPPEFPDAPA